MSAQSLERLIASMLDAGTYYLDGLHASSSMSDLLSAVVAWVSKFDRSLQEVVSAVEPCVRQSVLMSLLPARAFDSRYTGSFDVAIREHLTVLGIPDTPILVSSLRQLCININRLRGATTERARRLSASIADLRADPVMHVAILARQGRRCFWCGISLDLSAVRQSLDHIVPKHIGDDPPDGSNWAITCTACNRGKDNIFVWAASAAAFDYVDRNDFGDPQEIGLKQRWCTLARHRQCGFCRATPAQQELWVFRRVKTGLAIPANCSVVCGSCRSSRTLDVPAPRWPVEESSRPRR